MASNPLLKNNNAFLTYKGMKNNTYFSCLIYIKVSVLRCGYIIAWEILGQHYAEMKVYNIPENDK